MEGKEKERKGEEWSDRQRVREREKESGVQVCHQRLSSAFIFF